MKEDIESEDSESKETQPSSGGDGVKVPEAFQKQCAALIDSCDSMHCLDYLSNTVSDKRMELMESKKKETSDEIPTEYSKDEMPE